MDPTAVLTSSGLTGGALVIGFLALKLGAFVDALIAHQKAKTEVLRKQHGLT